MQSNTPAVENQPINFSNFPIEKKAHKADPFTIRDARYIGNDGFVVPSDFEEFYERFPDLIERAVILSNNGVLPNPLPQSDKNGKSNPFSESDNNPATVTPSQGTFDGSTRTLIVRALQAAGWIIGGPNGAACRLGLKRTTLIAKMKKLGISRPVGKHDTDRLSESRECEPWSQPTVE